MSSSPGIASIQTIRDGKIARTHHFEWDLSQGPWLYMEDPPRWFGSALDRSARRGLHERLYAPPEWPHAAGVRKPDGRILAIDLRKPGRWSVWLTDERLRPNHPPAPRRARSGARLATRTRSMSRPTAVWSRPTKAPFKRRSCSALRLARWAGPDASELEPTRRDQGHARIALHADPLASEGRGDPADRSRAGEGIEDGPALLAAFKRRPDHGLRDRVPNAVGVGARQRQHPAQHGSARPHDLTHLPEAQDIVDAVVPALPGACLGPEAARLKAPAGATEPAGDERVHPYPLGAVMAIADHQPQVAVACEDALPFAPEAHGQVMRVTFGRRTPPPSHPVRRRGHDHPAAPRRDRMEAVAVPAEQTQPPIAALVRGHGEATITRIVVHRIRPRQQPSRALALATMIFVPSFFSQKTVTSARVWPPSTRRPV